MTPQDGSGKAYDSSSDLENLFEDGEEAGDEEEEIDEEDPFWK